jgi:hypothetical protein
VAWERRGENIKKIEGLATTSVLVASRGEPLNSSTSIWLSSHNRGLGLTLLSKSIGTCTWSQLLISMHLGVAWHVTVFNMNHSPIDSCVGLIAFQKKTKLCWDLLHGRRKVIKLEFNSIAEQKSLC